MIQVQLRYFQYILSLAIFAGIVISSTPLISACFVGLTLIWLTETLVAQFDINTDKFYVVLVLLLIAFSTVSITSLSPDTSFSYLFSALLIMSLLYFLLQPDINIFKVGNSLFVTVIAMLVNDCWIAREVFFALWCSASSEAFKMLASPTSRLSTLLKMLAKNSGRSNKSW